MSGAFHFRVDRRDLDFNLFEFLKIQDASLGTSEFAMDESTARAALDGFETYCREQVAPSFIDGDRHPAYRTNDGEVHLPESIKAAIQGYFDGGWHLLSLPERMGGAGAPPTVAIAAFDLWCHANSTVAFFSFPSVTARVLDRIATDEQKKRFIPPLLERHWNGSMVLTEPDAGSDVGAARTKAVKLPDGTWSIEGTKRFITNGDFSSAENILHLVLARPEGAGPGTKGLSLFLVPKVWVNEDGTLGAKNGVACTGLEKKMGIKSSVTCEMAFGGDVPARGVLVGEVHDGIRQMFHVIEQARMFVGVKSVATLGAAYQAALDYAKVRVQGPALDKAADKSAPRVRIIEHADVRRMLMLLKSHAEGLRALALYTASIQDAVELAGGHSNPEAKPLDRLNDLLLPIVKGYCSERVYELLSVALQVHGGAGFTQDYPIEQLIRDQKIDSLYEGTTHIQALDLLLRKVGRDGGATLQGLLAKVTETIETKEGGDALAKERELLAAAMDDLQMGLMGLLGKMGESIHHVGLQGNRLLMALGDVLVGWLLIRHAALAASKSEGASEKDRHFFAGKVASARFFAREVLPNVASVRRFVENSELSVIDVAEDAF